MRNIRKLWPPENVMPEGHAPRSLADAEAELKLSNNSPRSAFDCMNKSALREKLYEEQHYLCAYCEQELIANPVPPIDHWFALAHRPDLAFHWRNLYLSCPERDRCDGAKKDTLLEIPWPCEAPYENWLGFTSDGRVYVRSDKVTDPDKRATLDKAIKILDLNNDKLVEARQSSLDSARRRLELKFKNQRASDEERNQLADALLRSEKYERFISIRIAWLKKTLGKHQPPLGAARP